MSGVFPRCGISGLLGQDVWWCSRYRGCWSILGRFLSKGWAGQVEPDGHTRTLGLRCSSILYLHSNSATQAVVTVQLKMTECHLLNNTECSSCEIQNRSLRQSDHVLLPITFKHVDGVLQRKIKARMYHQSVKSNLSRVDLTMWP